MPGVNLSLVKALRRIPAFSALDERVLLRVVGVSANLHWNHGSKVFEKGSPSEALYVVMSGAVRITDPADGGEDIIAEIEPGNFFGELSLLHEGRHSKSAYAVEDTELLVVPRDSFAQLVKQDTEFGDYMRQKVEQHRGQEVRGLT